MIGGFGCILWFFGIHSPHLFGSLCDDLGRAVSLLDVFLELAD